MRAALADDLVESRVYEVHELDLGYGSQAIHSRSNGDSNDARLGQGSVYDPVVAIGGPEPVGGPENSSVDPDVLTQNDDAGVPLHLLVQGFSDAVYQSFYGHVHLPQGA